MQVVRILSPNSSASLPYFNSNLQGLCSVVRNLIKVNGHKGEGFGRLQGKYRIWLRAFQERRNKVQEKQ